MQGGQPAQANPGEAGDVPAEKQRVERGAFLLRSKPRIPKGKERSQCKNSELVEKKARAQATEKLRPHRVREA
jgi:hypothetical protein